MALTPETEAEILRRHHADHWPVGTIATQLNLHRDSVARVLSQAGLPLAPACRASAIDPYLPFILETLAQFPRLRASRLYQMVKDRGYPGKPDHFRHLIARHRPRPKHEAYLRLRTLPGEQCQIDWGHFGHLDIGQARRPLMGFVAVLSWSRQIFLRFYLGAPMENFLRGHVDAFAAWGGIPRVALYDNLKSAVLERQGTIIRFNPTLLALAGHYRFEPRPVAVARGNQKGRVERAIRYIRDGFFAGCRFKDVDDLNTQAEAWTTGTACARRCPEDESLTVGDAFAQERERLLPLPDDTFPTDEIRVVSVGKTPYVRFDLNDYSIPHTCVSRILTVHASLKTVRILDGQTGIATHPRSFDRRRQIERIAQGMGHGVSLHGIEDKTIGQQEEDRKQDAHPTHAEPARHIPGRAAAKLSAAIAFFIQLSKGTFSKAAGHAEQGGNPHPEYGAGPTGGDRQRHPGKIAAADPGGKAGTERLKGR